MIRWMVVGVLALLVGSGAASEMTVPAGGMVDVGHGITVDNRQGNMDVEVTPESYFDPVSGDLVWILHVEVDEDAEGEVIVVDENDTYQGPPGHQNDAAVHITDERDPPQTPLTGPGATHGNGDVTTPYDPNVPEAGLKGVNRVNGNRIGGPG